MNGKSAKILGVAGVLAAAIGCESRPPAPAPKALSLPRSSAGAPELATPARPRPIFSTDVAPLLDEYCVSCHDAATARGGVVLTGLRADDPVASNERLWHRVAETLRTRAMPPEGEARMTESELETLNVWLDQAVFAGESTVPYVSMRRLNRAEYNNTVRDLIGLDVHPADEFPSDDIGCGFDNIGEVLSTPPVLLEMYLAAADKVIAEAFRTPAVRARILSPAPDALPRAYRRFTPPVRSRPEKRVFDLTRKASDDTELKRLQQIYDILRVFADCAFRRPALHDELMRLLAIVQGAEKDGESFDDAIQLALRAVLVSPYFLFHVEDDPEPNAPNGPWPANDFDLASRLSYFLWSSMPDEELTRLAARGELRQRETLKAQVSRMLRDRRSRALAKNFCSQWLQTRKLNEVAPDHDHFPAFDESLRAAMLEETERLCVYIQREDRSVLELIDNDYTFVNERLARHYGLTGIEGESFRLVSLEGTPRGGVLTHASILTVTSNPTRTSPVKRGKWILETLLGMPPAPPPAGVEALDEGSAAASGALRERLQQHRRDSACASCHARMDPLGFSLENFDAIGAWRTQDGDRPIDSTSALPGGRPFQGPAELRTLLLSRRDAFSRCLAEKMLTYALGRGLTRADRRGVELIVLKLGRGDYHFSALVLAVAESEPIQARKVRSREP
jgi:hypothetical protein